MQQNPVITTAAITSIVGAVLSLLTAFGVPMTPEQQAALSGFILIIAPWIVALVGQRTTTPLSKPRDTDGEILTRSDNTPAKEELKVIQTEAIEINKGVAPTTPTDTTSPTLGRMG